MCYHKDTTVFISLRMKRTRNDIQWRGKILLDVSFFSARIDWYQWHVAGKMKWFGAISEQTNGMKRVKSILFYFNHIKSINTFHTHINTNCSRPTTTIWLTCLKKPHDKPVAGIDLESSLNLTVMWQILHFDAVLCGCTVSIRDLIQNEMHSNKTFN